jgi:NAD(P)-dependent dehydrogenase (short-subunit alcohol dehydrogenase family)
MDRNPDFSQSKGAISSMSAKYTVFITGADKGLGRALVEKFLAEGFFVFAGLFDPATDLSDLQAQFGDRIQGVALDVSRMESIRAAADIVRASGKQLDVLLNNAGIFLEGERPPLEEDDFEDGRLELQMAVNGFGPLRVIQQFLPLMKADGLKRLTTISSESGSIAACWRDREFGYSMSKAAINRSIILLHHYLAPRGFQLLALNPGWMRTDMGGTDATRDPRDAAKDVFDLAMQSRTPDEPIFLHHDGTAIPW